MSGMDRMVVRKRPYGKYVAGSLVVLGLVAAFYLLSPHALTASVNVDGQRLRLATVKTGTFTDSIPLTGKIVPIETIYLDAVEGGKVIEVHVDEGDWVDEGAPLVTLENTYLQLEVIGREAQLTEQID